MLAIKPAIDYGWDLKTRHTNRAFSGSTTVGPLELFLSVDRDWMDAGRIAGRAQHRDGLLKAEANRVIEPVVTSPSFCKRDFAIEAVARFHAIEDASHDARPEEKTYKVPL